MQNNFLLDTVAFIWLGQNSEKLSSKVIDIFENPENQLSLSAVSIWEITLKYKLGKLKINQKPQKMIPKLCLDNDINLIEFRYDDALVQLDIDFIHRDPFDRMLVCQAINRDMSIITPDEVIGQYLVDKVWD